MKRVLLLLVPLALVVSACALPEPKPPTDVGSTGVTLNGSVRSNFGDTDYWWEYGTTTDYGIQTPGGTVAIPEDELNDPHPVSEPIESLYPGTSYHYRFCARDQPGEPGADGLLQGPDIPGGRGPAPRSRLSTTLSTTSMCLISTRASIVRTS